MDVTKFDAAAQGWLEEHIFNSVVSANTPAYNEFRKALPALKRELAKQGADPEATVQEWYRKSVFETNLGNVPGLVEHVESKLPALVEALA